MIRKIKNIIYYIVGFICFVLILFTLFNDYVLESNAVMPDNNVNGKMVIHYVDIDHGDATFIELPNKKTMLIDSGEYDKRMIIKNYIDNLGYTKIDYVIGTHPHSDHIGSLAFIIDNYDIGKVYLPKVDNNTKSYEYLLKAIDKKGLKVKIARKGVKLANYDNFKMYFISPSKEYYEELNNYSAVLKIDYYKKSFLFMADAEKLVEDEITDDVKANAIRVAHHGSFSSSSIGFVNRVNAEYAIISVGNNDYNFPRKEIINRWKNSGATVYRTDKNGTIKLITNGSSIKIETEKR